jgi:hypothetical protein
MDNNNLDYESTSDDNTSIEENERIVKLTKKASSKYINPHYKNKNKNTQSKVNQTNQPNQTINISSDIRKMVRVTNPTLLLIKGRK